ncbi:hypothetical protein A3Q56_07358, partial [Intoshia linei]
MNCKYCIIFIFNLNLISICYTGGVTPVAQLFTKTITLYKNQSHFNFDNHEKWALQNHNYTLFCDINEDVVQSVSQNNLSGPLNVTWFRFKNDRNIEIQNEPEYWHVKQDRLTFKKLHYLDNGCYHCYVHSSAGVVRSAMCTQIKVLQEKENFISPKIVYSNIGDTATFECSTDISNATWLHNFKPIDFTSQ